MATGPTNPCPTQALFFLNHSWIREQAQAAAHRALETVVSDETARIDRAYRATLGRPPSEAEGQIARRHLEAAAKNSRLEA